MFTQDKELHRELFYHHNFGHYGSENFQGIGINAKMSELQAAMGLAVFPYLNRIFHSRKSALFNGGGQVRSRTCGVSEALWRDCWHAKSD